MGVLESLSPAVEPYSIDEMLIDLRGINHCISPEFFGHQLREQVKSWTGLTMGWALLLQKRWLKVHSGQQSNGHSFPAWSR